MASSATVSLLPVSLSLVHIPRSRIRDNFHPILRQLLLPNPTFLNVTCNEIELSVFAEHHTLQDFELAARQDAMFKPGSRERPPSKDDGRKRLKHEWEPVEVSAERWNVLQIDSHSDGLDNSASGARVHELSAPLASAGISILYQSSYMSDFIFVKENHLAEVMSLLGSAGFDLYQSDPENLTSQLSRLTSPILSPLTHAEDDDVSIHLLDLSAPSTISPENGAILTRSRSSTDASLQSTRSSPAQIRNSGAALGHEQTPTNGTGGKPALFRSQSHSPSGSDVQVLDTDLTCIGLSDDNADMWGLKIVKLIAYPDLISSSHGRTAPPTQRKRSFDTSDLTCVASLGINVVSAAESTCRPDDDEPRASSESPIFDLDEGRPWDEQDGEEEADESSEGETDSTPDTYGTLRRPPLLQSQSEMTATYHTRSSRRPSPRHTLRPAPPPLPPLPHLVPFFSFTRTPEGSSLAAPVDLLASLFPPSERHMVICSGELDMLDSRAGSPGAEADGGDAEDASDDQDLLPEPLGSLRCLQIDLRKFGLDKHGLVNRYSRTLEENGINHMYSSTYKTANLLVDKAHAKRAQALLRSC